MPSQKLSLRNFALTITVICSVSVFICGQTRAQNTTENKAPPISSIYRQAPMLAQQVNTGKLPDIEQRLPQNPMLVQAIERIGTYGGVWNMAMVQGEPPILLMRTIGYEGLVRWNVGWTEIIPNVAQSYAASPDARTFTFKLRKGLKWSDGYPFTADDIVFWYKAIFLVDELQYLVEPFIDVGKDNLIVEKSDDFTVRFRFKEPQGLFIKNMGGGFGWFPTNFPRHYLSRFHKDFNPEINRLIESEGAENWVDLFKKKTRIYAGSQFSTVPEFPTLFAWVLAPGSYDENGTPAPVVRAVRNPYYWKIDTEYNQLPYIDSVAFTMIKNIESILPFVLEGKIDMQDRNIPAVAALPENQAKGGYGLYELTSAYSNILAISFNLTHKNADKRHIFRNDDFRIGLSYAIDRPAIIKAAGLKAEPCQVAPLPGSPIYNKKMATQHIEYSPKLANEYLDRAGYKLRDSQGFRLGPNGKRISFSMLYPVTIPCGDLDLHMTMIQAYWKAVGIDMAIERIPRAAAEKKWADNDYDVTVWNGEGGFGHDAILAPRHYVPIEKVWSQQGQAWVRWYYNPQDPLGEEPPEPVRKSMALYRQLLRTSDTKQQFELMNQIIVRATEMFHVMGVHTMPVMHGVVKPNFHNVPQLMFSASKYFHPAPTNPCQYFIDSQN